MYKILQIYADHEIHKHWYTANICTITVYIHENFGKNPLVHKLLWNKSDRRCQDAPKIICPPPLRWGDIKFAPKGSKFSRSCQAGQLTYTFFLGRLSPRRVVNKYLCTYFSSNWQLPLNQREGEEWRQKYFMTFFTRIIWPSRVWNLLHLDLQSDMLSVLFGFYVIQQSFSHIMTVSGCRREFNAHF